MSIFVEYHREWTPTSDGLPAIGQLVYYKTALYHFTGFLNEEGQWRNARGRIEQHPVVAWAPFIRHGQSSGKGRGILRYA